MDRSVFLDPRRQNHTSVQYALFLFGDGIRPYVDDKFEELHSQIQQTLAHVTAVCNTSCSRSENQLQNWCYTCSSWRTAILGYHNHRRLANTGIPWKHLDSSLWQTSSAEVMKCFCPDWCFSPGVGVDHNDVAILLNCMSKCSIFRQNVENQRTIRNDIAHHTQISNSDKTDKCNMLLILLQDQDIRRYDEARAAIEGIILIKNNTLKDIYDEHLLDEQTISSLERQLYKRKSSTLNRRVIGHVVFSILVVILAILPYQYLQTTDNAVTYDIHAGFRLDFEAFIDENDSFVGRNWLFHDIHKYLTDGGKKGVLIIADPGFGKTAIVEQLILGKQKFDKFELIFHLCRDDSLRLRDPVFFILNIIYEMYLRYPQYQNIMKTSNNDLSVNNANNITSMCTYDVFYCSRVLLILPMTKMKPPRNNLLIAVDALDRCSSIDDILSDLCEHAPSWIKIFSTTRTDFKITTRPRNLQLMHLEKSNKKHMVDFEEHVHKKYPHLSREIIISFSQKMEYDFYLLDMVENFNKMTNKDGDFDVTKIVPHIHIIFEKEMHFLFDKCSSSTFKEARWIFEIIAASFDPISVEQLTELHDRTTDYFIDNYAFKEILQKTCPHVLHVSKTGLIKFKYILFKDWLTSGARAGLPCFVDIQEGHRRLAYKLLNGVQKYKRQFNSTLILVEHIKRSNDVTLYTKFSHLPSYVVDEQTCFINFNRTVCMSSVEHIAKCVNSYPIMQMVLNTSRSRNITQAALNAVLSNHMETLRAILETGKVDLSSQFEMFDLQNQIYDTEADRYIEKDAFTILHFAISHDNTIAIKQILEYNISAVLFKTRSGCSVLQHAIIKNNIDHFISFAKYVTLDKYILHFAAYFNAYKIFVYLLKSGVKDECIPCRKTDIQIGTDNFTSERLNRTLEFNKDKISLDKPPYNFLTADHFIFFLETTCESVFHFLARTGNLFLVQLLFQYDGVTNECYDFQGLTPFGNVVVFNNYFLLDVIPWDSNFSYKFKCKPVAARDRMNALRKLQVSDLMYTDLRYDEYCSEGSSIGHLLARHLSCGLIKALKSVISFYHIFNEKNKRNETPLYWLFCKTLTDFRLIKNFLFMLESQGVESGEGHVNDEGLCSNFQYIFYNAPKGRYSLCNDYQHNFPEIADFFLKHDSDIYNGRNMSAFYRINKLKVIKVYFLSFEKPKYVFSFIRA